MKPGAPEVEQIELPKKAHIDFRMHSVLANEDISEQERQDFLDAMDAVRNLRAKMPDQETLSRFDSFYTKFSLKYWARLDTVAKSRDQASSITALRGAVFELTRIAELIEQNLEEVDFDQIGQDIKVTYKGFGNKDTGDSEPLQIKKDAPIEFDVPVLRDGKPFVYETKSYPRRKFGEEIATRNQLLKYQSAIEQGVISGASLEIVGRMDIGFLLWAMGGSFYEKGAVPGVEIIYVLPLPSGKEYRFVLKRALVNSKEGRAKKKENGLKFKNDDTYEDEDKEIIIGLENSLVDKSIAGILADSHLPQEKIQAEFEKKFPEPVTTKDELVQAVKRLLGCEDLSVAKTSRVMRSFMQVEKYEYAEETFLEYLSKLVGYDVTTNPEQALRDIWENSFKNPKSITSSEVFQTYDRLQKEGLYKKLAEKRIVINSENQKSAVSEFARPAYVEESIRTFLQYLKHNPHIAAAKKNYIIDEADIPKAVGLMMDEIERIAEYEVSRGSDAQTEELAKRRATLGYGGKPEGITLDIEHIMVDVLYSLGKSGVDAARSDMVLRIFSQPQKDEERRLRQEREKQKVFDWFFTRTENPNKVQSKFKSLAELEAFVASDEDVAAVYKKLGSQCQTELQKIVQEAAIVRSYHWPERFQEATVFMESIQNQDRRYQEIQIYDPITERLTKQTDMDDEQIHRAKLTLIKENIRRAREYMVATGREGQYKNHIVKTEAKVAELEAERDARVAVAGQEAKIQAAAFTTEIKQHETELRDLEKKLTQVGEAEQEVLRARRRALNEFKATLAAERAKLFSQTQDIAQEYRPHIHKLFESLESTYKKAMPKEEWDRRAQRVHNHIDQNVMKAIYVVTAEGEVIIQEEVMRGDVTGRAAHSELAQGRNVYGAGELALEKKDGKWVLTEINNGSGHYRPDADNTLEYVKNLLKQKGIDISQAELVDAILRGRKLREGSMF